MRAQTRARLADEAATWRHLGLIDESLSRLLAERYDARGAMGELLRRWLAMAGIGLIAMAVLSLVGIALAEAGPLVSAVAIGAGSFAAAKAGARMALDPRQRHPLLGAALITIALMGLLGTLTLAAAVFTDEPPVPLLLSVTAAAAIAVAYRLRLRWPLLLGVLLAFHAVGSWHAYGGHGSYFLVIADERLMVVAALAGIGVGLWHEHRLEAGDTPWLGFGGIYVVLSLLYLNLSLWFLSLSWHGDALAWVLAFTAAGIGQLVAGAALRDGRFTGFGIVFLSIDLYTRFFEHFWDRLSAGASLALCGVAAMAIGALCERLAGAGRTSA